MNFQADEIIMHEGDAGEAMYIMCDGSVAITKRLTLELSEEAPREKTMIRFRAEQGVILGEMALIESDVRSATVTALTPCLMLELTKEKFYLLLEQYPEIGVKILLRLAQSLSQRLRKSQQRTRQSHHRPGHRPGILKTGSKLRQGTGGIDADQHHSYYFFLHPAKNADSSCLSYRPVIYFFNDIYSLTVFHISLTSHFESFFWHIHCKFLFLVSTFIWCYNNLYPSGTTSQSLFNGDRKVFPWQNINTNSSASRSP